ncbi:hypothetical protein TRIUR3_06424 [Triticum urartu]|uniref:Uncharacterized protein n=1 Tax=Triticum urartu TaxID=4572 RepID=M8ASD9_TRIUA|nr:hypothetical protein TRIUR3_06424 [Triticum urartu]
MWPFSKSKEPLPLIRCPVCDVGLVKRLLLPALVDSFMQSCGCWPRGGLVLKLSLIVLQVPIPGGEQW